MQHNIKIKNNSNNIYHITLSRRTRVYPPSHSNIGFYRHVSKATPNVRTLKGEEQNRVFLLVSETRITSCDSKLLADADAVAPTPNTPAEVQKIRQRHVII